MRLVAFLLVTSTAAWTTCDAPALSRRAAVSAALATVALPMPAWSKASSDMAEYQLAKARRKFKQLPQAFIPGISAEDAMALELLSRQESGSTLDSGIKLVEVMEGTGPAPSAGDKVYIHYKFWTDYFDKPPGPIEASYFSKGQTPLGYILGDASTSGGLIVEGIDIGVRALGGMKEGGWRRLIVPAALAYRDAGLPASETASRMSVPPNTPIYVDVHMMDAGSGKCDRLISKGLKTTTCSQPSMNVAR